MDLADVLALVVGVAAIVATVFAARRWGSRRRRLSFEWRDTSLMSARPGAGDLLRVTYRDIPVDDPHHITVTLRNVGPTDIATAHFDGGKPLVVDLGCKKFFGLTRSSAPGAIVAPAIGAEGAVQVNPLLLRRGEQITIEAVVDGKSSPALRSPLIDTDVIDWVEYEAARDRRLAMVQTVVAIVSCVVAVGSLAVVMWVTWDVSRS